MAAPPLDIPATVSLTVDDIVALIALRQGAPVMPSDDERASAADLVRSLDPAAVRAAVDGYDGRLDDDPALIWMTAIALQLDAP